MERAMSIQNYMNITAKTTNRQSQNNADIVIVGNGIAGLTAAIEARRLAPALRIAIITEQSHPTINTPALKQFAIGKLERQQLRDISPRHRTGSAHPTDSRASRGDQPRRANSCA